MGGVESELSEGDIFEVLSNQRRRHIVRTLKTSAESMFEVGDLAERIAAREEGINVTEVSYDQRKSVYTALHQSHLPKMDELGIVEFDKDRGTVEPTAALEEVELYLEVVRKRDIPWSEYYLGLSAVSLALLSAAWVEAWPLSAFSGLEVGLLIAVSFLVSAAVHTYYTKRAQLGVGAAHQTENQ